MNRIHTNLECSRRHLSNSSLFPLCHSHPETIEHLLRDCQGSAQLWRCFVPSSACLSFFAGNRVQWLKDHLWCDSLYGWENWGLLFGTVCWLIWKRRCNAVFGAPVNSNSSIIAQAKAMVAAGIKAQKEKAKTGLRRDWILVGWRPPPGEWIKVNSDGAVNTNSGRAAARGLMRDSLGRWLGEFCRNVGFCSVPKAELWGIFDGLSMAYDHGFRKVVMEVDSQLVLQLISGDTQLANELSPLIKSIKDILAREWEVRLLHTCRQGNRCADFMASLGFSTNVGISIFASPPNAIRTLLSEDAVGAAFPLYGVVS